MAQSFEECFCVGSRFRHLGANKRRLELEMDRETAFHCEAMLSACKEHIGSFASYLIRAFPPAQRRHIGMKLGTAIAELGDISTEIHKRWPETDPDLVGKRAAEILNRRRQLTRTSTPKRGKRHKPTLKGRSPKGSQRA